MSRSTLLNHCKLLHGLLNTNLQNQKYYGRSETCPHCQSNTESFLHVLYCDHPVVTKYRVDQQAILWKALAKLNTPLSIMEALKEGIMFPHRSRDMSESSTMPSSTHSNQSSDQLTHKVTTVISAFNQQTELGWENFLRGQVTKLWGEAFYEEGLSRQSRVNKKVWTAGLVRNILS
jgi:hypothetical protein